MTVGQLIALLKEEHTDAPVSIIDYDDLDSRCGVRYVSANNDAVGLPLKHVYLIPDCKWKPI